MQETPKHPSQAVAQGDAPARPSPLVSTRAATSESSAIPDLTEWDVQLVDRKHVGTVKRLLVDRTSRALRYLQIKIDADAVGMPRSTSWNVLVPVGRAQLHGRDDVVILPALNLNDVHEMPKLVGDVPSRTFELALVKWFGARLPVAPDDSMYRCDVFELEFLTRKRARAGATWSRPRPSPRDEQRA